MRRSIVAVALLILVAFGAMLMGQASELQSQQQITSLGITQIKMGPEYISRDGHWLLAFVPSGSTDERVLVSINGHWVPDDRVDYVAASAKTSEMLGPGVQVYAYTNSGKPFPKDASLVVTIIQPGAKFGDPRPADNPLMPHP